MIDLTDIERLALQGIQARQQQVQFDQLLLLRAIERRLQLSAGAIGTTHQIDATTWRVLAIDGDLPGGPHAGA